MINTLGSVLEYVLLYLMQCAAVRTHWSEIRVPPQVCLHSPALLYCREIWKMHKNTMTQACLYWLTSLVYHSAVFHCGCSLFALVGLRPLFASYLLDSLVTKSSPALAALQYFKNPNPAFPVFDLLHWNHTKICLLLDFFFMHWDNLCKTL